MERLDPNRRVAIPMSHLPIFRTEIAIQNGVEKRLLFRTWGGIGDQICAEPTIRYGLKMFKGCEIHLASELPGMFEHLNFKRVFNLKDEMPNYSRFLLFDTITPPDDTNIVWQFMSHMLVNCVDFPSQCALRQQLPIEDKVVQITGTKPKHLDSSDVRNDVVVHPGKHWQSKTFPKDFWDRVLASLLVRGVRPIIIGADADDNRGTVDVNPEGCLDLRNKLSITESIWLLKNAPVLLTNDSSPLHMAVDGNTWIGFVATCKHQDFISHWRRPGPGEEPVWKWRMKHFNKGGLWEHIDYCPNKKQSIEAEFVPPDLLLSWLPNPTEFAEWAVERANEKH